MISLPDLPYSPDALAPVISAETLRFHHGKHHRAYVDALNKLLAEAGLRSSSLEAIVRDAAEEFQEMSGHRLMIAGDPDK